MGDLTVTDEYERLKRLFVTTEKDKDRFHIIAKELLVLCDQSGFRSTATEIADRHGGLGHDKNEILIELR